MNMINTLKEQVNNTIEGQYLLTKVEEKIARNGNSFKELTLEDSSGSITAYVWPASGMLSKLPYVTPTPVRAILNIRRLNEFVICDLIAIYTLAPHEVWNAANFLPLSRCPCSAKDSLKSLVKFIDFLPRSPLKDFVNNVLFDPEIANNLLTAKGSVNHHHNYTGGLLEHSVEALKFAYESARSCGLDDIETQITAIAALLHDIGKIRTVGSAYPRPVHYSLVSHDAQNLLLLSKHLDNLDLQAPEEAAALKYIFNYLVSPKQTRGFGKFIGADIVTQADELSTALKNKRRLSDLLHKTMPAMLQQGVNYHLQQA